APYTAEHTSGITGIPAADIERLALDYAREPAAFIRLGLGVSRHDNGGMMVRTIACLPTLTGKWANKGGGFLCYAWGGSVQNNGFLKNPAPTDPPARTVNMIQLGRALTELRDPPVMALYVYNSNPAAIAPEQAKVHAGLAREDLFVAVHEQTLTDTTDFADIVLPATTFMEHEDLITSYGHNYAQVSRPAISPVGEARCNLDVFQALAKRMGYTETVFSMSFDQVARSLFKPAAVTKAGFDMEALMAGQPVRFLQDPAPWQRGLKTPSGKFEFHSALMEAKGQPAAPAHVTSEEGHVENAQKRRFPLQLLTPPSQHFLNSSFGDAATSKKLEATARIKLHPRDATARGLADGTQCRAYNDRGECFLTVEVTDDVQPGVVVTESVWWPKWMPERKGINQLTTAEFTDLGDCAQFHNALVEVEPA
ncbi:MAG TPA: molybdopterin dinucleotide binding domain-containing protein, partial [bacterium]